MPKSKAHTQAMRDYWARRRADQEARSTARTLAKQGRSIAEGQQQNVKRSPAGSSVNYDDVLADLKHRRERLDDLISILYSFNKKPTP